MKPFGPNYVANIINGYRWAMIDLYTFTLANGAVDRYACSDFDVYHGSNVYKGKGLIVEGLQRKIGVGLTVDEQNLKISAYSTDTLASATFFTSVMAGLLDGAYIKLSRAFWAPAAPGVVGNLDTVGEPQDVIDLYVGLVSTIDKIGRTNVELKVKSPLKLLDLDMPRNTYQAGCLWSLFDNGCTLSRAAFTFSGTVLNAFVNRIDVSGGIGTPTGADGQPYFAQGRIKFTSGAATNLTLTIGNNDSTTIFYMYPPVSGVLAGDTFDAWPGCAKTVEACDLKFSNKSNFRGFPRVPPIVISA